MVPNSNAPPSRMARNPAYIGLRIYREKPLTTSRGGEATGTCHRMATGCQGPNALLLALAGQARTRLARAAVIAAARDLFLDRGYPATTVEAISGASDVPPATVYRLFSSKLGISKALLDVSIAGDDQAVPLQDLGPPRGRCSPTRTRTGSLPGSPASAARSTPDRARLPHPGLCCPRPRGQHRCSPDTPGSGSKAKDRSPGPWPAPARCGPGSPSAAPPTSSTRSCPPRSTGCSSQTGAGHPQRYQHWLTDILTSQLLPPPATGADPGPARAVLTVPAPRRARHTPA